MLALQGRPPLIRGLFAGFLYALVILITNGLNPSPGTSDLVYRVMFGVAAGLVFQQVTDGAVLLRGARTWRNPHRWMFGYVLGACWAAIMIIALWDADAPARHVAVWAFSGALFGAVMAIWPDREMEKRAALEAQYRTDAPQFGRSKFFFALYFAWPFVTWALVLGLAGDAATTSSDDAFLWFIMILFISLNSAYLLAGGTKAQLLGPTTLGLAVLVIAVWLV